jgi:hypothetical protein
MEGTRDTATHKVPNPKGFKRRSDGLKCENEVFIVIHEFDLTDSLQKCRTGIPVSWEEQRRKLLSSR